MMRYGMVAACVLASGGAWAAVPEVVRQDLQPGGFYVAKVPAGSRVTLDGVAVEVGPKGEVVVGFDRNTPLRATLKVCQQAACTENVLALKPRTYVTQNVKGVPAKTVNPDPKQQAVMKRDREAIAAARAKAEAASRWRTAYLDWFKLPIEDVPHSSVFGSRRTYNGEERSWHNGYDLAAGTGTPVKAPADGIVRLARDTFMSGKLIMLDHGGAITTVYAHLSAMDVKAGDAVKAGEVIGKVGTTGRSSGPHLHWGLYWKNTPIDPILWVRK